METYMKAFLRKFIAALFMSGVESIPFSGERFQKGVEKMQESLKNSLSKQEYDRISDVFIKTPVQEMYNNIRDLLMSMNGDTISFMGVNNPYWTTATIKMNPYYAKKILNDKEICDIDNNKIQQAAKEFCDAAGVMVWEEF